MSIKSNSNKAKKIIRAEIRTFFSPKRKKGGKSSLDNMKKAADSYDGGYVSRYKKSDYVKGGALVDAAAFAIWSQDLMLNKIYGEDKVKTWTNDKKHETYKHLIAREYVAMLNEKKRNKNARK